MMATAFMGYVLPWGQMSFWGATVITNLFSAVPVIGDDIVTLLWGGFSVDNPTLNRMFALHFLLPFVILGVVIVRHPGAAPLRLEQPAGHRHQGSARTPLPFHPYYTVHDILGVSVFLMVFTAIIFFAPELGGYFLEYNNFIPADPLKTPAHIAPVWYFTPFYSMLRATTDVMVNVLAVLTGLGALLAVVRGGLSGKGKVITLVAAAVAIVLLKLLEAKFWGVVVMGGAVIILFFLPWLDHSPVKSIRYRPSWHKYLYGLFVVNFVVLAYLGVQPPCRSASGSRRWARCSTSASSC